MESNLLSTQPACHEVKYIIFSPSNDLLFILLIITVRESSLVLATSANFNVWSKGRTASTHGMWDRIYETGFVFPKPVISKSHHYIQWYDYQLNLSVKDYL